MFLGGAIVTALLFRTRADSIARLESAEQQPAE
jgi:hypothetical protein